MKRVVLVDDEPLFCRMFRRYMGKKFPELALRIYEDPADALDSLDATVDLLLLDWNMPVIDGAEFLARAVEKGVPKKRIVILSGHPAEKLHEQFAFGSCLAVLEKYEGMQKKVLDMLLASLEAKGKRESGESGPRPPEGGRGEG